MQCSNFEHITCLYVKNGRIGKGANMLTFVTGRSTDYNEMDVADGLLAAMYATISYHTC